MGKNKHKKNNPEGITSSVGGTFKPKKKKKGLGAMTPAREAVRREIRDIINQAREEKDALKRKVSHAAKSGIKGLKIDGAHLVNILKGIKFKDEPSSVPESQQPSAIRQEPIKRVQVPKEVSTNEASYYDTWYYIIESELKNLKESMTHRDEPRESIT